MILRPLGCLLTDEQRVISVREEAERLQPQMVGIGNGVTAMENMENSQEFPQEVKGV